MRPYFYRNGGKYCKFHGLGMLPFLRMRKKIKAEKPFLAEGLF
jgi:hypothetical protein